MRTTSKFEAYDQLFQVGVLLAILEYHGAIEPIDEQYHLTVGNSKQLLALFPEAIYRMHESGYRGKIEELLLSIGDVPREIDAEHFKQLVDGYKVESLFQTPYPGYQARKCAPYQATH